MTNRVDRLAKRGLASRLQDPSDGRGVLVVLTDDGRTLVDRALVTLVDLESTMLDDWAPAERGEFAGYLRRLLLGSAPS